MLLHDWSDLETRRANINRRLFEWIVTDDTAVETSHIALNTSWATELLSTRSKKGYILLLTFCVCVCALALVCVWGGWYWTCRPTCLQTPAAHEWGPWKTEWVEVRKVWSKSHDWTLALNSVSYFLLTYNTTDQLFCRSFVSPFSIFL